MNAAARDALVPAVTSLNVDGFYVLDENSVKVFAVFSSSRHCTAGTFTGDF